MRRDRCKIDVADPLGEPSRPGEPLPAPRGQPCCVRWERVSSLPALQANAMRKIRDALDRLDKIVRQTVHTEALAPILDVLATPFSETLKVTAWEQ